MKPRIPEPKRAAAGLSAMLADGTIPTDYAYGQRIIFVSDFQAFIDKLANTDGRGSDANAAKYPFTSLMVGQSFTIPGGTAVAESVRAAARNQTARRGWHFRVERPDKETIRVTRVSAAEEAVVRNDDRLTRYPWKDTAPGERFFVPFKKGLLRGQARHAIRGIVKARTKNRPAENYEIDWTDAGGWVRRVAAAAMLWLLGAGAASAGMPPPVHLPVHCPGPTLATVLGDFGEGEGYRFEGVFVGALLQVWGKQSMPVPPNSVTVVPHEEGYLLHFGLGPCAVATKQATRTEVFDALRRIGPAI